MAFLRFNRDKRGYEHFYLVESTTNRRGKTKPRVLYWFRSPPGVRVGRQPFDEGVRRALETQNPGVTFDWPSIVEAPIPSADADKWRERRRAEKAAKHAMSIGGAEDEMAEDATADAPSPIVATTEEAVPSVAAAADGQTQNGADPSRKRRRRRRGKRPGASQVAGESPAEASAGDAELVGEEAGESDSGD